jgi:hypothetical protein
MLHANAEPVTKHRIVQALFEPVEVLGPNEVWLYPSVEAPSQVRSTVVGTLPPLAPHRYGAQHEGVAGASVAEPSMSTAD